MRLDRLQRDTAIVENGKPTIAFQNLWQNTVKQIEDSLLSLQDQLDLINAATAAAATANAAAATANAAAATANTAATTVAANSSLASSGVAGLTMTATDAGANATITISAHDRIYGDGTTVSVAGGSITGLAYSTIYYVYYDDAARIGGAVTFFATTDDALAAQIGDRHSLGTVETPAALAAPVPARPNLGPGVIDYR